jgi:hypothetical protein
MVSELAAFLQKAFEIPPTFREKEAFKKEYQEFKKSWKQHKKFQQMSKKGRNKKRRA